MYQELCNLIPGGVNSPVNAFIDMGVEPFVVERGFGDTLIDTNGNSYIDYCCSWGALIHGHAHPKVMQGVRDQLEKGTSYGLSGMGVMKLAQEIIDAVPAIEKVRFVSSGTEATTAAVRLARGFTKRNTVVKFIGNYHGHADQFLLKAGSLLAQIPEASSAGVPNSAVQHMIALPYNDMEACREVLQRDDIAAVIIEPVAANMGVVPATQEFLEMLRKETKKSGALLIFDEVITGFRLGYSGAQGYYGVMPDLTCLGKIMGGGFPAAAFGGSAEIMDYLAPKGPVFQAGTLSGNPVAMAAGYEAIKLLQVDGFYDEMERKARRVIDPVSRYIEEHQVNACINRIGCMFTLFIGGRQVDNFEDVNAMDKALFPRFFRHMLSHGIYVPPSQFELWSVSAAHTDEHLDRTANAVIEFLSFPL